MIAPTAPALILAAFGAPLSLLLAVMAPALWPVGAAWIALVAGLILVDALLAPQGASANITAETPQLAAVGDTIDALVRIVFPARAPRALDIAIETNALLSAETARTHVDFLQPGSETRFKLQTTRRGQGVLERVFVRWNGPLGLASRQHEAQIDAKIAITPDIAGVEREASRLFSRTQVHGIKPLRDRGEGSEFDALVEFQAGMDRRLVDWKQSARHLKLLNKEVRAERNHQIVLAFDTGRLMCEPVAGAPRIDWALNAGLMLAYVGLKLGDRVGLFAFDAHPHLASGFVSGARAFTHVKLLTAAIDYTTQETNFTLGLSALASKLQRRSMVIVFTDFADSISAELMIENIARLMRRHLVVFVAFRDEELEAMRATTPEVSSDVSRAVIAHQMLRERDVVLARLRRMGAQIVEAPAGRIGPALVQAYDILRKRERV
jgi:uncharacterized protein (DUF58 family)